MFQSSSSVSLSLSLSLSLSSGCCLTMLVLSYSTLDEQSLQSAADALLSLGSTGRLVGIISHSERLREHIPTILSVTTGREGSHACFRP